MSNPAGIWANHAHVFPREVRPHGSVEKLLRLMDDCEIERTVCFAPFAGQLIETRIDGNAWLAGEVQRYRDRLLGFGTVDLAAARLPGQVAEQVTRIRDRGFLGVKVHPAVQQCYILSEPLLELYGRAQELGLFLSFHTGVHHARLSDARLIDFDAIAYRFPSLRFSLEHVGGYAFMREAVGVIQNNLGRPHGTGKGTVYAGLTSIFSAKEPAWHLPPTGPGSVAELIAQIGDDHAIFGLDFPYKSTEYVRQAIAFVGDLPVSADCKQNILGGTLRSLLAAPPAASGSPPV